MAVELARLIAMGPVPTRFSARRAFARHSLRQVINEFDGFHRIRTTALE